MSHDPDSFPGVPGAGQASLVVIPAHARLSFRAILVPPGVDASAALAAAGIYDPVSVPCVIDDAAGMTAGLGAGPEGRLTAVLEMPHTNADSPE